MSGKIGIFAPGQIGDIMTAMSVFKYHNEIWPNKDIVWFCDEHVSNVLELSPVSEIRPYTNSIEDYRNLKINSGVGDGMNRLDIERAKNITALADLEVGYFPLPWMLERVEQREGIPYPRISQKIFGVDLSKPWRPYLCFSDKDKDIIKDVVSKFPYKRTVMFENSPCAYSDWNDDTTRTVMSGCRKRWGSVNFIFASGGSRSGNDMSRFFDYDGCVSCSHLTVKQIALLNDHCDLFVGVGGALTFSTSCWGAKPTPKLIYTGSEIFGTRIIANGRIEVITTEAHRHNKQSAEAEFKEKLDVLISEI